MTHAEEASLCALCTLPELMIRIVINSVCWHLLNQNSPPKNTLVSYSLNVFLTIQMRFTSIVILDEWRQRDLRATASLPALNVWC